MNLYLYIPNHSASPPGLLKSLVYGLLATYKRQNSDDKDFQSMTVKLFERLVARGYPREKLKTLFLEVAQKLDSTAYNSKKKDTKLIRIRNGKQLKDDTLFFHLTYHPKSISRKLVQQKYKEHCEIPDTKWGDSFRSLKNGEGGAMEINKMTVAYNRPKNLRDLLSPSRLLEFDDCSVHQFM